jgi:hypothetical protein
VPNDYSALGRNSQAEEERDIGSVCTSVCTPLDGRTIEAAIGSVTRLLAATNDAATAAELVRERAALRAELAELRQREAGVVFLDDVRARTEPGQ